MKSVAFLNLGKFFEEHRSEILGSIESSIRESHFIGGPEVEAFQKEFANWLASGVSVMGCANGTDAIFLAAKALALPQGTEAIVPAMTYVATVEGLLMAGYKVRLVDIHPDTYLMEKESLEDALTKDSKIIAAVHLYGQMAPMDAISEIAEAYQCKILEDSAQSHGALWNGKAPGHWGDVVAYSFYPGKNLGAYGDAGAVASKNADLLQRAMVFANHGGLKKYEHKISGMNSRLDGIQATILRLKLKYLTEWNERRRWVADQYRARLGSLPQIKLPTVAKEATPVWHLYVIQVKDRDRLQTFLGEKGVQTGIHYPKAIHQLPAFEKEWGQLKFPNAEKLAREGLSLPMCPYLSEDDIGHVCDSIHQFFG